MNWNRVEGNWRQFTGQAREKWGELTEDELAQVDGRRDRLAGLLQERYGIAQDEANRRIDEWADNLKDMVSG
jgi:uncharacterized protein YjbJ (UPF0337 family)